MLITEEYLKKEFTSGRIKEKGSFILKENEILTPSAKTFLNDKSINLIKNNTTKPEASKDEVKEVNQYSTIFGATLYEKPEHMTHLRGNTLVFKDHPVIKFRGEIDYLESEIIMVQVLAQDKGYDLLVSDLEEVMKFVQNLIRVEITGERIDDFNVLGLTSDEIRDYSHHPSKYFNLKHFIPSYKQGEIVAHLNKLRTITRQVELVAYNAFVSEYGESIRNDIIKALNRLSSLFWIMRFKYLAKKYEK